VESAIEKSLSLPSGIEPKNMLASALVYRKVEEARMSQDEIRQTMENEFIEAIQRRFGGSTLDKRGSVSVSTNSVKQSRSRVPTGLQIQPPQ
jgi:hypothetical protein